MAKTRRRLKTEKEEMEARDAQHKLDYAEKIRELEESHV